MTAAMLTSIETSVQGARPNATFMAMRVFATPSVDCLRWARRLPRVALVGAREIPVFAELTSGSNVAVMPEDEPELWLLLADAPHAALAAAPANASAADLATALAEWQDAARSLLQRTHRWPNYCLLIDVSRLPADGVPLCEGLAAMGVAAPLGDVVDTESTEAACVVEAALTEQILAEDPASGALYDELRVSGHLRLSEGCLPTPSADGLEALVRYRATVAELAAHAATAEMLADGLERSRAAAHDAEARNQTLQQALLASESAAIAHDAQIYELEQTRDLLVAQLQQLDGAARSIRRTSLERQVRLRAAEIRAEADRQALAELNSRIVRTQSERQSLADELERSRAAAHDAEARNQTLQQALLASDSAAIAHDAQIYELEQTRELLVAQLQQLDGAARSIRRTSLERQVQLRAAEIRAEADRQALAELNSRIVRTQSERQSLADELASMAQARAAADAMTLRQRRSLERDAEMTAWHALPRIGVDAFEVRGQVSDGPHRHLDFTVLAMNVGDRRLDHLDYRLVEHHGRPGLAVFAAAEHTPPLAYWQPDGEEHGRSFMLFIPADAVDGSSLTRLAARDWTLICALAQLAGFHLDRLSDAAIRQAWLPVVLRLANQLRRTVPRLRYDTLCLRPAEGRPGALDLVLDGAQFATLMQSELRLRWWPSDRPERARLEALRPPEHTPCLWWAWPADANGAPASAVRLPVGSSWSRIEWATLPQNDAKLWLSLLDRLPAAAALAATSDLPGGWTAERLARSAMVLNRVTLQAIATAGARAFVSRLFRRPNAV